MLLSNFTEIQPGLYQDDDRCLELVKWDETRYTLILKIRHGSKRFLGMIERVTSDQWAVCQIVKDEIPAIERMGVAKDEAMQFLCTAYQERRRSQCRQLAAA